jgi:hypothetical protein
MLGSAILLLISTAAGAQPVATTFDQLQRLASDRTVIVTDGTGHRFRGRLATVTESQLCVQIRPGLRCFDAPDVATVRVRNEDSLANGAFIGAAVGGGLTSLIFLDNECRDDPSCYGAVAFYGGVGAAAGLIVDALIHSSTVVYTANRGPTVTLRPMGLKGLRLTILF